MSLNILKATVGISFPNPIKIDNGIQFVQYLCDLLYAIKMVKTKKAVKVSKLSKIRSKWDW